MGLSLKMCDLFAGIGGIRLGFEQAMPNAETVFVSEWDKYAQQTYRLNFPKPEQIAGDITEYSEMDIPSFDICLAGFPCQAFSVAGARKGFNDNYKGTCRGTLFLDVVRICEYHKPKVIFCENVKGLVGHDHGQTFKIICDSFEQIGYTVFWQVLNSRYFGVPQNRERTYIVAFRNDIAPLEFEFPSGTDDSKRLYDILEKNPVPEKYYLSKRYLDTLERHKARHQAKGNGFGYVVRENDDIASAIVCGGMGKERNLIYDARYLSMKHNEYIDKGINNKCIRKMTPQEWARLQGFPDSFQFNVADTHIYEQLGNSVTVPVIKAIAENIYKVLEERKS